MPCRWCAGSMSCRSISLNCPAAATRARPCKARRQTGGTAAREAYFLDFARDVSAVARMPVMVTGGIRRRVIAEQALRPSEGRPGVAMVGIASAFAFEPKLAEKWKGDEALDVQIPSVGWRNKAYASLAKMALVKLQLRRLGRGLQPKPDASPLLSLIRQQIITKRRTRLYRAWVSRHGLSRPSRDIMRG